MKQTQNSKKVFASGGAPLLLSKHATKQDATYNKVLMSTMYHNTDDRCAEFVGNFSYW